MTTTRRHLLAAAPALALAAVPLTARVPSFGVSPQLAALQARYRAAYATFHGAAVDIPDELDERLYNAMVDAEDEFLAFPVANVADVHAKAVVLALLFRTTEGRFDQERLDQLVEDLASLLPPHSLGVRSGEARS